MKLFKIVALLLTAVICICSCSNGGIGNGTTTTAPATQQQPPPASTSDIADPPPSESQVLDLTCYYPSHLNDYQILTKIFAQITLQEYNSQTYSKLSENDKNQLPALYYFIHGLSVSKDAFVSANAELIASNQSSPNKSITYTDDEIELLFGTDTDAVKATLKSPTAFYHNGTLYVCRQIYTASNEQFAEFYNQGDLKSFIKVLESYSEDYPKQISSVLDDINEKIETMTGSSFEEVNVDDFIDEYNGIYVSDEQYLKIGIIEGYPYFSFGGLGIGEHKTALAIHELRRNGETIHVTASEYSEVGENFDQFSEYTLTLDGQTIKFNDTVYAYNSDITVPSTPPADEYGREVTLSELTFLQGKWVDKDDPAHYVESTIEDGKLVIKEVYSEGYFGIRTVYKSYINSENVYTLIGFIEAFVEPGIQIHESMYYVALQFKYSEVDNVEQLDSYGTIQSGVLIKTD